MKCCTRCGQRKYDLEFYVGRAECKDCTNAYQKEYDERNRERIRLIRRAVLYDDGRITPAELAAMPVVWPNAVTSGNLFEK